MFSLKEVGLAFAYTESNKTSSQMAREVPINISKFNARFAYLPSYVWRRWVSAGLPDLEARQVQMHAWFSRAAERGKEGDQKMGSILNASSWVFGV